MVRIQNPKTDKGIFGMEEEHEGAGRLRLEEK